MLLRRYDTTPDYNIEFIEGCLEAGEHEIALETLCTQLYEYDLHISATGRTEIEELSKLLGVDIDYIL